MKRPIGIRLMVLLAWLGGVAALWPAGAWLVNAAERPKARDSKTVADRLSEHGETARGRLKPYFKTIGQTYPPRTLAFIGIKDEEVLQVYVTGSNQPPKFLRSYPILAASGELGPKLREGDRQVPEGIYRIEFLNPNSSYHLSMRVSYPNEFDRAQARAEGRRYLGGDIMIHGNAVSIGCLAMGDQASEDLFVLAADTGIQNITVILTPVDFRSKALPTTATNLPAWTSDLYAQVKVKLNKYPKPPLEKRP